MELRQLVYFEAVVRHGGFTRAAEQLHVAQSAVSSQIRALEKELGAPLLSRTSRRVLLTHAGELFLERVQTIIGELHRARADLAELSAVVRGRVAFGATPTMGGLDLPCALASFSSLYPGVEISLRSGLISPLLDGLVGGDLDLVLGPVHPDLPSHFATQPLLEEEIALITPPGHRLAQQPVVSLQQVRDDPFVCLAASSGLMTILRTAAQAAGFTPRVPFETHSPQSIRELVAAGLGVALLARSAATTPGPAVGLHTLTPPPAHPPVGLIHHRDHRLSQAAQAFRRHLHHAAQEVDQAASGQPRH